jgi:hypothetical protein
VLVPLNRTALGRGGPQPEIADMAANCRPPSLARLHAAFLSIVPRIELHGRVCFRAKSWHDQQEAVAEMVALCWKWFVRLAECGKDATHFPSVLATFAARAVYNGRRLAGSCKAKDAMSPVAQRRHGVTIGRLPDVSTLNGNPLSEALHDNTRSPVPEQVAFRLDFPGWLSSLGTRNRSIAQDMAQGHRTGELADAYGLSPARVSQLRREFHWDWQAFCGDLPASDGSVHPAGG